MHMASNSLPRRRLRIPAALAVVVVGGGASIALAFAGCDTGAPPIDAKLLTREDDAGVRDAKLADVNDGGVSDAHADARIVDARPDALIV